MTAVAVRVPPLCVVRRLWNVKALCLMYRSRLVIKHNAVAWVTIAVRYVKIRGRGSYTNVVPVQDGRWTSTLNVMTLPVTTKEDGCPRDVRLEPRRSLSYKIIVTHNFVPQLLSASVTTGADRRCWDDGVGTPAAQLLIEEARRRCNAIDMRLASHPRRQNMSRSLGHRRRTSEAR